MTPNNSRRLAHVLRFTQALALVGAAPACVMQEESVPPPLGASSGGGVVVQGGGVVQNNTTVLEQGPPPNDEQNVQMHTVVVGQGGGAPLACGVGQRMQRGASLCDCVATTAGPAWACRPYSPGECVLGSTQERGPGGDCTCVEIQGVARWRCESYRHHMVGPLPPPTLDDAALS